jgi:hypothetical protein
MAIINLQTPDEPESMRRELDWLRDQHVKILAERDEATDELRRTRIILGTVRKELKSELDRAREREISLREQLNNERAKNAAGKDIDRKAAEEIVDLQAQVTRYETDFAESRVERDRETRETRVEVLRLAAELDAERARLHKIIGEQAGRVDELIKFVDSTLRVNFNYGPVISNLWQELKARVSC